MGTHRAVVAETEGSTRRSRTPVARLERGHVRSAVGDSDWSALGRFAPSLSAISDLPPPLSAMGPLGRAQEGARCPRPPAFRILAPMQARSTWVQAPAEGQGVALLQDASRGRIN